MTQEGAREPTEKMHNKLNPLEGKDIFVWASLIRLEAFQNSNFSTFARTFFWFSHFQLWRSKAKKKLEILPLANKFYSRLDLFSCLFLAFELRNGPNKKDRVLRNLTKYLRDGYLFDIRVFLFSAVPFVWLLMPLFECTFLYACGGMRCQEIREILYKKDTMKYFRNFILFVFVFIWNVDVLKLRTLAEQKGNFFQLKKG